MGAAIKQEVEPQGQSEHHDDDDHDDGLPGHGHKKGEEGEGPWLVSYADLMTLLMGFFALLASMSTPQPEKVEKVAKSTSEAFGSEYKNPYEDLRKSLEKFIKEKGLGDVVQVEVTARGVQMTFKGTLFFDSGSFVVRDDARGLMEQLAQELKGQVKPYKILVEGHTDSVPISHEIIASNWELSGIRAARIAQLFEGQGFTRDLITIIGWGDTKPVVPDKDESGQYIPDNLAKNRRVVIQISDANAPSSP